MTDNFARLLALTGGNGGSGGTTDYETLNNKPSIGGTTLIGDLTLAELGIIVDDQLNLQSTNPVQNAVLTALLNAFPYSNVTGKPQINGVTLTGNITLDELGLNAIWVGTQAEYAAVESTLAEGTLVIITDDQDVDNVPTQNSTNLVTSGGVYAFVVGGYQTKINSQNKLDADLVDDTNATHKFATSEQLSQIATNTANIANKVDKVNGKGLSTEDYTTAEKTKLTGIEAEANKTVVDSALSDSSINPVQNKVVTEKLAEKVGFTDIDSALSTTSENPVQNKIVTDALGGKVGAGDYATASTAGIVKPDGVTITADADGTIHAINTDLTSWYGVRDVVRRGLARRFFQEGDQLVCKKDGVKIRWDIIGIDQDTPADSNFVHSMTLMVHDVDINAAFDAKEALFAFDDGLEAGTYHFTIDQHPWVAGDVGKTVQFTLQNAIPAGGQLVVNNGYNATMIGATISAFSGGTSVTVAETVTMTEGSDGTDLGSVASTLTGTTTNSIQRALLGSNNWSQSAARQYLNSDKEAGAYWTPKTKWDRPPGYVASTAGFLKGLDGDFVGVLGKVIKTTSQNTVTDGGGGIQSEELVFLPSMSEIYGSAEISGVNEGEIYDFYKNATAADRIKYQGTAARYWFLRTSFASSASLVRIVTSSGVLSSSNASIAGGLVPACCIV